MPARRSTSGASFRILSRREGFCCSSFVTRDWSERAKNEVPAKPQRTFRLAARRLLPSVDCLLALPMVASFPILAKPDPLLSSKSVASFFKSSQFSAVNRQLPDFARLPPNAISLLLTARSVTAFCRLPLSPANGGFVPDSGEAWSFIIKQIGGFVFQKLSALSRQLSASGLRAPSAQCLLPAADCPLRNCLLLTLSAPRNGGFVPNSGEARSFIIKQIRGFVFRKALSFQPSASGFPEPSRLCLCRLPSAYYRSPTAFRPAGTPARG